VPFKGVNLKTVVKSYRPPNDDGVMQHDAIVAVDNLKAAVVEEPANISRVIAACTELGSVCDSGFADRYLAVKCDAYDVLVSILLSNDAADGLSAVLSVLSSLTNDQPDILDDRGATCIVNILCDDVNAADLTAVALNVIRQCCIMHEANRQQFVALDIIPLTAGLLTTHHSHRGIVQAACGVFSALTLDDDIRVPYGKSHEHAKAIVVEGGALEMLLQLASGTHPI